MKQFKKGFTFIEMMIAVLIVGIIASVAYPSYLRTVMKSNRTDAKSELMDFQQRVQRCYTANGTYVTGATAKCKILDDLVSGVTTRAGLYVVSVSGVSATEFTLTAEAISKQADDKDCAFFNINQAGVKSAVDSGGSDSSDKCW